MAVETRWGWEGTSARGERVAGWGILELCPSLTPRRAVKGEAYRAGESGQRSKARRMKDKVLFDPRAKL